MDIDDVNDTPPRFQTSPSVRFSENTNPGDVVTTLTTVDADVNPVIRYSVIQVTKAKVREIYRIKEFSLMLSEMFCS